MAFGIPTPEQLQGVITDALNKATGSGVQLEDHARDILQTEIHSALSELFLDLAPIEEQFTRLNTTLENVLAEFQRLDGAQVTLRFGDTIPQGRKGAPTS